MQDKPRRDKELKKCEEALPRLKKGGLEKASRLYKAKTGVGCDGFHPQVLEEKWCNSWKSRAKWKMAATSLYDDVLLDSEEHHK